MHPNLIIRTVAGASALAFAVACEEPAVIWADTEAQTTASPSPIAHPPLVPIDSSMRDGSPNAEFLLVQDLLREAGAATLLTQSLIAMPESRDSVRSAAMMPPTPVPPASESPLGDGDAPIDSARCGRSLRVALAPGRGRVAAWWTERGNSRVWLMAAWRDTLPAEGRLGSWRGPIVIDSLDRGPQDSQAAARGAAGCSRPAPSIAYDDHHGFAHVAYVLAGPEGAGVFYAHQMDPRSSFEPPIAIMYGDRLGAARVAAWGDVVAVAYEDPNSARGRVGLAVSRTAGHLFEERMMASGTSADARDPYVVVRGRAIVEGWSEQAPGGGDPVFKLRRAKVRP
jgi:hypothetical protein